VRERLAVSKRGAQKIKMERFNLKKLNKGDIKEQDQVTIRNKFAALENLEENGASRGLGTILENTKFLSKRVDYCESKKRKLRFAEECLKLVDRRKQAKLQWLQDPSKVNEYNLNEVRRETGTRKGNI
jgi:hypothetical protein